MVAGVLAGCAEDEGEDCPVGEIGCACWVDDADVDQDGDGSVSDPVPAGLEPGGCEPGAHCVDPLGDRVCAED